MLHCKFATVDGATKNAGVENAEADSRGGKCRSRKAEPILYNERLKIVFRFLTELRVVLMHYNIVAAFVLYSFSLLEAAFVM